jgi:hypothetical protein
VSTEFKRKLEEEAMREKRSVTNYLEVTLQKHWQESASTKTRSPKKKKSENPA